MMKCHLFIEIYLLFRPIYSLLIAHVKYRAYYKYICTYISMNLKIYILQLPQKSR